MEDTQKSKNFLFYYLNDSTHVKVVYKLYLHSVVRNFNKKKIQNCFDEFFLNFFIINAILMLDNAIRLLTN